MSAKSITILSCPYCESELISVTALTDGLRIKTRCPKVACRRRLTISGQTPVKVFATKADIEADGVKYEHDRVDLDRMPLEEVRQFVRSRDEAIDLYLRDLEEEQSRLNKYVNARIRAETEVADAHRRVDEQVKRAGKTTPNKQTDDQQVYRSQLLFMLKKYMAKGRISAVEGARLSMRSHLPKGMDELADAVKVPRWSEVGE